MGLKVIGAGFGRTGTLSLKFALEKLGFDKCYHMMEVQHHPEHVALWQQAHAGQAIDWDALFSGYQATVDWPSCNLWREQLAVWPDAKVILSHRDPGKWHDSVMATIYKFSAMGLSSPDPMVRARSEWASEIIWNRVFDGRVEDRDYAIEVFERHKADVEASVPAEQLLCYQPGDGWEPLCEFLGVAVPDEPYPRTNSTEEFSDRWKKPSQ